MQENYEIFKDLMQTAEWVLVHFTSFTVSSGDV